MFVVTRFREAFVANFDGNCATNFEDFQKSASFGQKFTTKFIDGSSLYFVLLLLIKDKMHVLMRFIFHQLVFVEAQCEIGF